MIRIWPFAKLTPSHVDQAAMQVVAGREGLLSQPDGPNGKVGMQPRWWQRPGLAWNRFWFEPVDATTLCALRICTGLVLLYSYLSCAPRLLNLIGPDAWIDARAIAELRAQSQSDPSLFARISHA